MASCMPWTWRAASCEWSRSSDDHLRVSAARRLGPTRSPLTFHSRAVVAVSSHGGAVCHHEGMSDTSFVSVGPKGRVVIPVAIRRALDLREGSELVATVDDGAVVLVPRSAVKARLRSLFAEVPTSMRDELLVDRRAAAAGESSGG